MDIEGNASKKGGASEVRWKSIGRRMQDEMRSHLVPSFSGGGGRVLRQLCEHTYCFMLALDIPSVIQLVIQAGVWS
jgi:hypothetical protein